MQLLERRTLHFVSSAPTISASLLHHVLVLSQLHLSLGLSPCSSPSLSPPAEGPAAWMRCWVHGNWVSIDWTAAWPMGARGWEQQHGLRLSSHFLQKKPLWGVLYFFILENASTSQHILSSAVCLSSALAVSFEWLGASSEQAWLSYFTVMSPLKTELQCQCAWRARHWGGNIC